MRWQLEDKDGKYGTAGRYYPVIVIGKGGDQMLAMFTASQMKVAIKRGLKAKDVEEALRKERG